MTIYLVSHDDKIIEFSSIEAAQAYANEHGLANPESETRTAMQVDMVPIIASAIAGKQVLAAQLLREIYAANVLAGITSAQSDQLFDDFADVILRIKEGAFATALYRLGQKSPEGFVTQALIDQWTAIIQGYM